MGGPTSGSRTPGGSPFLPVAVLLHLGLFAAWSLAGPRRVSSPNLKVMRLLGAAAPGAGAHPLIAWGIASGLAGVFLVVGVHTNRRRIRVIAWAWGAAVLTFIGTALLASTLTEPAGSPSAPIYVFGLVGAHLAAATRERGR